MTKPCKFIFISSKMKEAIYFADWRTGDDWERAKRIDTKAEMQCGVMHCDGRRWTESITQPLCQRPLSLYVMDNTTTWQKCSIKLVAFCWPALRRALMWLVKLTIFRLTALILLRVKKNKSCASWTKSVGVTCVITSMQYIPCVSLRFEWETEQGKAVKVIRMSLTSSDRTVASLALIASSKQ